MKLLEEMTFSDDYMFSRVLTLNKDLTKHMLEIITGLKIKDIHIKRQEEIKPTTDFKSIRLDVTVYDADCVYDVEMQTVNKPNLGKRIRYYQSTLDSDALSTGNEYEALKKTIIIFICTFDPFKRKQSKYIFHTYDIDNDIELRDDTVKIVLNAKAFKKETNKDLRSFLEYVLKEAVTDVFTKDLDEAIKQVKINRKERDKSMTLYESVRNEIQEARIQEREQTRANERKEIALNLLSLNLKKEDINKATGLSLKEINKLDKDRNRK